MDPDLLPDIPDGESPDAWGSPQNSHTSETPDINDFDFGPDLDKEDVLRHLPNNARILLNDHQIPLSLNDQEERELFDQAIEDFNNQEAQNLDLTDIDHDAVYGGDEDFFERYMDGDYSAEELYAPLTSKGENGIYDQVMVNMRLAEVLTESAGIQQAARLVAVGLAAAMTEKKRSKALLLGSETKLPANLKKAALLATLGRMIKIAETVPKAATMSTMLSKRIYPGGGSSVPSAHRSYPFFFTHNGVKVPGKLRGYEIAFELHEIASLPRYGKRLQNGPSRWHFSVGYGDLKTQKSVNLDQEIFRGKVLDSVKIKTYWISAADYNGTADQQHVLLSALAASEEYAFTLSMLQTDVFVKTNYSYFLTKPRFTDCDWIEFSPTLSRKGSGTFCQCGMGCTRNPGEGDQLQEGICLCPHPSCSQVTCDHIVVMKSVDYQSMFSMNKGTYFAWRKGMIKKLGWISPPHLGRAYTERPKGVVNARGFFCSSFRIIGRIARAAEKHLDCSGLDFIRTAMDMTKRMDTKEFEALIETIGEGNATPLGSTAEAFAAFRVAIANRHLKVAVRYCKSCRTIVKGEGHLLDEKHISNVRKRKGIFKGVRRILAARDISVRPAEADFDFVDEQNLESGSEFDPADGDFMDDINVDDLDI